MGQLAPQTLQPPSHTQPATILSTRKHAQRERECGLPWEHGGRVSVEPECRGALLLGQQRTTNWRRTQRVCQQHPELASAVQDVYIYRRVCVFSHCVCVCVFAGIYIQYVVGLRSRAGPGEGLRVGSRERCVSLLARTGAFPAPQS